MMDFLISSLPPAGCVPWLESLRRICLSTPRCFQSSSFLACPFFTLVRPSDLVTCPYHFSFRHFTVANSIQNCLKLEIRENNYPVIFIIHQGNIREFCLLEMLGTLYLPPMSPVYRLLILITDVKVCSILCTMECGRPPIKCILLKSRPGIFLIFS